jgi:hypothetical protein
MANKMNDIKIAVAGLKSASNGLLSVRNEFRQMPQRSIKIGQIVDTISVANGIKTSKGTKKSRGSVASRSVFEIVRFREQNTLGIGGTERGKINDKKIAKGATDAPFPYDPFSFNTGAVSNASGFNRGGDSELPFKKTPDVKPKNKILNIGRKNVNIVNPDPFPQQLYPNQKVKYNGIRIRTSN